MTPAVLGVALAGATLAGLLLARRFEPATGRAAGIVLPLAIGVAAYVLAPEQADPAFVAWSVALVTGLVALGAVDAASRSVPDALSIPMIAGGILHAWARGLPVLPMAVAVAVVIGVALAVSSVPSRLRHGIGGGDVLLLAGGLAWLGPMVAVDIVLLTGAFLIPVFAWHLAAKSPFSGVPVAPALGASTLLLWLKGPVF
jgi:leader peptidase (prepilin peptidase) / N-methyltransferase